MNLLAFETSCDETSVAVLRDGAIVANAVSSQIETHAVYGGVVPELATRQHLKNIPPLLQSALHDSGLDTTDIDAVAATQGPGLPPALMIGFRAAQGYAFALKVPFVGVHHHEAHLYSPWISGDPPRAEWDSFRSSVSLIVSGGHTLLVRVDAPLEHRILGGTIDDAAGECFDKVAKLIGLPYPGGPEMDRLAAGGNSKAFQFPRPMLKEANDDFSFSGLKTSVRCFLEKHPEILESGPSIRDLCASVQAAIVEVLVTKTIRTAKRCGLDTITAAGGVACNSGLRSVLERACERKGFMLRIATPKLCTDNAGMVAVLGDLHLKSGRGHLVDDGDVKPGWSLDAAASEH
ncbi:MAG: tRNA N6-adenosine threonylcarbamoyltransferase [Verrucomicrobia subdivision 3 bacterium]|nr:tRNA N6-adenosine threonylcarbamoyltransferase [Limisphaerales bacterium]MCS1412743.1 tRNA N6-adenosine threonylcarbamoyltransferase [Limisphaerales bacterium]